HEKATLENKGVMNIDWPSFRVFLQPQQLIERQIRRNIQYRWIFRWIFRQNTVRLFTSRPPADGHREDATRPWSTSIEPANVHVKCAHGARPTRDSTLLS